MVSWIYGLLRLDINDDEMMTYPSCYFNNNNNYYYNNNNNNNNNNNKLHLYFNQRHISKHL